MFKKYVFFIFFSLIILIGCKTDSDAIAERNNEKQVVATMLQKSIKVDGDLSEWKGLTSYLVTEDMNVETEGLSRVNKATTRLNSRFYVQWDMDNLYLACNVVDDVIVNNILPRDKEAFYRTDSVEFYIDTRKPGREKVLFKIAVLPFDLRGDVQACRHEDANPGPIERVCPDVRVASKRTDSGYSIEVLIPFKYLLDDDAPVKGTMFGFSHSVHNSNDKSAVEKKISDYVRQNMISWNPIPKVWNRWKYWSDLILQ